MKAIVIDRYGDAQELHEAELPVPTISADEVLVKMVATSVNPIDWRTRKGTAGSGAAFPMVLAGTFRVWSPRLGLLFPVSKSATKWLLGRLIRRMLPVAAMPSM